MFIESDDIVVYYPKIYIYICFASDINGPSGIQIKSLGSTYWPKFDKIIRQSKKN